MITVLCYLAIMAGCVLFGFVLSALLAQSSRNEIEAGYRTMLFEVWWSDEVGPGGMSFDEWLAWLAREAEARRRAA